MYFCSQSGNMDRAEMLVREMEADGIDAPIDVYHSMMHGYTIVQDEKKCLIVFERLKVRKTFHVFKRKNCLFIYYDHLLNLQYIWGFSYGMEGEWSAVLANLIQCFFHTLQECGFKPSIISYGCLINLYVKVCSSLVCSHVLQPVHRAEYA